MADTTSAPSPHTPTARKGPVTLSPSSKGPAKAQQERKNSDPQSLPTFVSQQRRESAAAKGPILAGNKRKVEDEEHTSATVYHQIKAEGADQDTTHPGLQSSSQSKKPKIPSLTPDVGLAQEPTTTTPSQPPSARSIPQTTMFLHHILTLHIWLIPPPDAYIISANIDDIAHAMWQSAFDQGPMLARACQYSAMFSPLKLAALAKLNFLPSWWFFREVVVKELPAIIGERSVDDGEMQEVWREAVRWCTGVLAGRGGVGGVERGNM